MYTRETFLYTQYLESSTEKILEDFHHVYGDVGDLNIIKPPKQDRGVSTEWVGSFSYFQKRNPQWDEKCQKRSIFLKRLVASTPSHHLLGIWFSAILPNGTIQWHTDMYDSNNNYIRVHLPLIVPEGDLGITIDTTTYKWHKGQVLCFDPFVMHTAWNKTSQLRLNINFNYSRQAFAF